MKRYLLFFGDSYYPQGGWHDFAGSFDTIADAQNFLLKQHYDWYDIVDSTNGKIIPQMGVKS